MGEMYVFLMRMLAVIEGIEILLGMILAGAVGLVVIVRWALTRYGG